MHRIVRSSVGLLVAVGAACAPNATGHTAQDGEPYALQRAELVRHLERQGIADSRVLAAMGQVPRHEFVPQPQRSLAYIDQPLPIGYQQTISQPYVVALMSELLACDAGDRVLEIGTGSGYQAAILAAMGCDVYSIEIVAELGARAAGTLQRLGYAAQTRVGDGYLGWPEAAPFAGIIVTAAPDRVPEALIQQLDVDGRMVIPVGPTGGVQQLMLLRKRADGSLDEEAVIPVRFVPMVRPR